MAKTLTQAVLVTSATKAAGATTRGRVDCSAFDGGILTFAITNGGTAPTAPAVARVLVSHSDAGSMPSAAAEGTGDDDWKQVYAISGGNQNSAKTRGVFRFGPEVRYLEIEFPTHTGNDVTIEAIATLFNY